MPPFTRMTASLIIGSTFGLAVALGEATSSDEAQAKGTAAAVFKVPACERQLFFDDHGIAEIHSLIRTMHQPAKRGAVIRPDQPWETALQTRCVPAWDEADQVFKIWLITSTPVPEFGGTTFAQSKDGIHWTKPILRQREYQGSRENNFLSFETNCMENVVYDPVDPDPNRRYKAFLGALGRQPAVSPDGIHWTKLDVPMLPSLDESNMSYDRQSGTFIATFKQGGPYGRSHALSTSKDFEAWTKPQLVFHADELDQELGTATIKARFADSRLRKPISNDADYYNVDVYNLAAFRYEGIYVGLAAMFHSTGPSADGKNTEGFHLVQLVSSRDLRHWKRLGSRQPFIGPSQVGMGAYDLTQILPPSAPVICGDELWFYYTGLKYRETPENPDPDGGAICLAVLRRDGFVSLDAAEKRGSIVTEPFRIPGRRLFVNVDAPDGELRATILNASGQPMAGFGIEDCVPVTGNWTRAEVTWTGGPDHWPLTAQDVQIRFRLQKGSLYSYWFEDAVPPAPFLIVKEDFETAPVGSRPRLATAIVENRGDSIRVTNEAAAGGKKCLKVVDAPGLGQVFNPHFYYEPMASEGIARCSFDIRLGEGADMYHAWRDEAANGPMLAIKNGTLEAAGRDLLTLPADQWIHFDVVAGLGASATSTWDLAVTLPDKEPQWFRDLPISDDAWNKLTWLGFVSNAVDEKVFYLDNIELVPLAPEPVPGKE